MSNLPNFKELRHDKAHHLGLGDIRLTIAQQDAIDAEIERLRHEIDVQCSSEYVETLLKTNERLRAELVAVQECERDLLERDIKADDEIERLRAALEAKDDRIVAQSSTNQRYRAALERIECVILGTPDQFKAIAREALKDG